MALKPVAAIGTEQYVKTTPGPLVRKGIDDLPGSVRARFEKIIREGQDSICRAISEVDGTPFREVRHVSRHPHRIRFVSPHLAIHPPVGGSNYSLPDFQLLMVLLSCTALTILSGRLGPR